MAPLTPPAHVRVPRVRPFFGRLWYAWRDRLSLARARRLAPAMLAQVPALEGEARAWGVRRASWSRTGVAVLVLAARDGSSLAPAAVLKASFSSAAARDLDAQASVLARLRADDRLGEWRALLPRVLGTGEVDGLHFMLQQALPGVAAQTLATHAGAPGLLAVAAGGIRPLHARSAQPQATGEALLAQAIDAPIERIRRAADSDLRVARAQALARLGAELRAALAGRVLRTGWIHGDFWLGNVLVDARGATACGIVDWSSAAPQELPLHDILHLILHQRQVEAGRELGDIVRDVLGGAAWAPHERAILEAQELGLPLDAGGLRAMVLLYWLRRLSAIFEQERGQAGNRVWTAWNIDRVLQCL